uniref:AB hydrolase-1 domain-containing protein n=1 Tax=Echinococcus granulosus TaxID=6210 RepID=A0A068WAT9_ECHGR|nr:hypothetical protein EgrG_000947700 [Echinococcus granulosus]
MELDKMAALRIPSEQHHELELPIGKVNVYVQGNISSRTCVFLTVHDLGCNHYQYEEFVDRPKMRPIMERAVWLSVDLPGQGDGEEELPPSYTFPTLWSIAESLKSVLDHFSIDHVVLFGEGAGANILARFAMLHDEMVMGAVLIHCTGQTASFADSLRDKASFYLLILLGAFEGGVRMTLLLRHTLFPKHLVLQPTKILVYSVNENSLISLRRNANS